MTDPRIERCREVSQEMARLSARVVELTDERRRLLLELRSEGLPMGELASMVGVSRQWLYRILGPVSDDDRRRPGPRSEGADLRPSDQVAPDPPTT